MCLGAAHRGSRRIAPSPARRARERPARRPLPSASAPEADHAAALWQLCCRIGRTTTVAWQRVGPYARCHHLRPRATGSILGTNSRATQRAGELAAADPAYRARLARRLQLDARSRPETLLGGAPFGHALERALVRGKLVGCGAIQRDVRRLLYATRPAVTRKSSLAGPPALGHPPIGHPGLATPRFRHTSFGTTHLESTILPRPPWSGDDEAPGADMRQRCPSHIHVLADMDETSQLNGLFTPCIHPTVVISSGSPRCPYAGRCFRYRACSAATYRCCSSPTSAAP